MFREPRAVSPVKPLLVFVALFSALPYAALAQRGAGSVGGGTAGGGGLSGHSGIASGIDTKDDLKDFHDVLAVQASSQQVTEYKAGLKSTESARAELKTLEQLKMDNSAELQLRRNELAQKIEVARMANTKFLEHLSDRQKSGLRENLRKLSKADSDLAQEFKALDVQLSGSKTDPQQITASTQGLDRALSAFRDEQVALGDEMSMGTRIGAQDGVFSTAPVRTSIKIEDQSVSLTTRAVFSKPQAPGDNPMRLVLTSDMSDLQQKLTDILRAALNKSDGCGEQLAVQGADLVPSAPTMSLVRLQVHYERWACMGRGNANEMVEGNGTMEVKLAPSVSENGALALVPAIGNVDAEGLVGELLRSGSLGEAVRDKIADTVLLAIVQGADYKAVLPPAAQGNVKLQQAHFQGSGANVLAIVMEGGIQVSPENMTLLLTQLKAGEGKVQSSAAQSAPR
jgi:hypothetical protein